jgi:hypothetical protein
MVRTFLKVYMELGSYFLFLQEQIKDIIIKVLDKSISADGNSKANVDVNHKRRGREQETEVREGGIGNEQVLCGSVRISRRDALDENLGLVMTRPESSLRTCLMSESTSSATDRLTLI